MIATCPVTELEFFFSARSIADRERRAEEMQGTFTWVPVADRAYDPRFGGPGCLDKKGQHRGAEPVDLIVVATAELRGMTLLHHDHDFDCIAKVTGQSVQWYGVN